MVRKNKQVLNRIPEDKKGNDPTSQSVNHTIIQQHQVYAN